MADIDRDAVEGYRDGFDLDSPEPNDNRSAAYRHCFWRGRDDAEVSLGVRKWPRMTAQQARDAWAEIERMQVQ